MRTNTDVLDLPVRFPLRCMFGGRFVSRGQGRHPTRTLSSYELIFVREGTLRMVEAGRYFTVQPNEALVLWPGRRHAGVADYPPDLTFYWIHFTLEPTDAGEPLLSIPQQSAVARPDRLVTLFHRYLEEQEAGTLDQIGSDLMLMLMLREVVAGPSDASRADTASAILASRAEGIICTQFHTDLSTIGIAEQLGCSADYLGRTYRNAFGVTIVEAIHRRRMYHACRMLVMGDMHVDEVARACGFTDGGYFRRIFKRHEGVTPLAYQRLHARANINTE